MTKNEYLQKLSDALITDEESKQAVLRFYEELIEDRQECGMSEEEAVADMERIEDLAGRLNDEFSAIVAEAKPDETAEKAGEAAPKKPFMNLPFEINTDELGRMGKDALRAAKGLFKDAVKGFNKAVDEVADLFKGNGAAGAPEEAEVKTAEDVAEMADEAIETAEEEAERLSEAAEEAEEEAGRLAEKAEKLVEAAEEEAERLTEEAEKPAETADEEAERLTEEAEAAEEAAEAAEEVAEAEEAAEEKAETAEAAGEEKKTGEADPMEQIREFAEKLNEKVTAATGAAGGILRQMAEGISKLVNEAAEKAQKAAGEAEKTAEPVEKAVEETAAPVEKAVEEVDAEPAEKTVEEADAEPAEKTVEPDQHAPLRAPWVTPPETFEKQTGEETAEQNENPNAYKKMEFTCEPDQIRAAMLNAGDFPIRVAPSGDGKVHLTYYTNPKDEYTAGVEDGVLTLNHLGKRRLRAAFSFSINLLLFKFNVSNGKAFEEITLLLPPAFDGDVTVRNSNARVGVEGLFNLSKVDVRTSNASVGLTGLKANEIIAAGSNGRVVGDSVECGADLRLSTSNGSLKAGNVKCGGRMELTTSNGSVEMVDVITDAVHAATSNATIRVDHIAAGSYELCTSNGTVSGVMPGKMDDYAISSHTSNGKNSLPENTFGAIPFKVRTSNGAIRIAFAGDANV